MPEFRYTEPQQGGHLLVVNADKGGATVEVFRDENRQRSIVLVPTEQLAALAAAVSGPIPMRLLCPICGELHIDEGEFETKPHHTHACQTCGHVWRPAIVPTVGVRFLPGFKNA